jgi:hypothetical protein
LAWITERNLDWFSLDARVARRKAYRHYRQERL